MTWIKNTGTMPNEPKVHIKLNCDEVDMPGIQCIRFNQHPERWDWRAKGHCCVAIEEYMIAEE